MILNILAFASVIAYSNFGFCSAKQFYVTIKFETDDNVCKENVSKHNADTCVSKINEKRIPSVKE